MLTINTNLSSLIAQGSMKSSTNKLNQAIERMTTGFKINHAKDNAANYQIASQMTTQINSLQVAEENTAMGLDMVTQASEILDELNNRVQRLRDLQEQANNGTYGEQSLKAINVECNALVDEINRIYESAEYNGITLFMAPTTLADGRTVVAKESDAQLDTTFKDLGVVATHFEIFDSTDTLVQAYDLEENDTVNDFLTTLQGHGFTTELSNGKIIISSTAKSYIVGDLADELGISTTEDIRVTSTPITETIWTTTTTENTQTNTIWTTTTSSTTQTNTVLVTTQVETTSVTETEAITTDFVMQTETLQIEVKKDFMQEAVTYDDTEISSMTNVAAAEAFISGEKYSISSIEELQLIADYVNTGGDTTGIEFVLSADLDLSSVSWTPIGNSSSYAFKGCFDGNGHIIKNISSSSDGLFGNLGTGGQIKNLGLIGGEISSSTSYTGGLVGYQYSSSTIQNCYTSVNLKGSSEIGGLVGLSKGNINHCYALGSVTSSSYSAGGLVGWSEGYIGYSFAKGDVSGTYQVGGLVGANSGQSCIVSSYAEGNVTGTSSSTRGTGGFIGSHAGSSLNDCYATGNVTSNGAVGGFTGRKVNSYTQNNNCYSSGSIIGSPGTASVNTTSDWDGTMYTYEYLTEYTTVSQGTKLTEYGLDSLTTLSIRDNVGNILGTFAYNNTFQDVIDCINNVDNLSATLNAGILKINSTGMNYLDTNSDFFSFLPVNTNCLLTTTTITTTQTIIIDNITEQLLFETIYTTTTSSSTETETITITSISSSTYDIIQTLTTTISTTQSMAELTYLDILEDVYAPGTINLMVGTTAEPESSIRVDVSFKLTDLRSFRNIGVDGNDYLEKLDNLLTEISARQVQFGAVQNRLESVMDEISIKYDNLVSSRSTIRDADIAEVSSTYIQQQILQQASATLLATANQSPAIALQLI